MKRQQAATSEVITMIYTVEQVAEILQVSVATVRKHIKAGRLKGFRVGPLLRVKKEDLDRFMNGGQ